MMMTVASPPWYRRRLTQTVVVAAFATAGILIPLLSPSRGAGPTEAQAPSSKPLADTLFRDWPQKAPDLAIVLSGEQHSYIKFCGCSSPQLGGFERRFNVMAKLKEKGWPVTAFDLGDLAYRDKNTVHQQTLLKYEASMKALGVLGYPAMGIGQNDYRLPIEEGMARYTLQNPAANPKLLAANLNATVRMEQFPLDANTSMIGEAVIVAAQGSQPATGAIAIVGPEAAKAINDNNPKLKFDDPATAIKKALQQFQAAKVELRVLLFFGMPKEAEDVVKQFPQFQIVLCRSVAEDPPAQPHIVGNSMLVEVGFRGRYIGIVGAFRTGNAARPFELHYQLVSLGEDFETDPDKIKAHPVINILEEYALRVKAAKLLPQYHRVQHPVQLANPGKEVAYVGSETCKACHPADYQKWKDSKHAHAFDALTKVASKPSNRQFDGECVRCHVVGFEFKNGFEDSDITPHLHHVGCENCHGPASLHVAEPQNKTHHKGLSPWKVGNDQYLRVANGKLLSGDNYNPNVLKIVDPTCQHCHDQDNDPHFRFEKYWPQIEHGKKFAPAAGAGK